MILKREELIAIMKEWNKAWDRHDLNGVMALFHDEVLFENWSGGKAVGKEALQKAWAPWFADHGDFRFKEEDLFADAQEQKVLYAWELTWPSREKGFQGKPEKRRGVDVIFFKDGRIIKKVTYSKTTIEIEGQKRALNV